jgi:hypothetical protein
MVFMNDLSDEAICEYANSKVVYKYDPYQQAYADGVEHGMVEARRRVEATIAEEKKKSYDQGVQEGMRLNNEIRERKEEK